MNTRIGKVYLLKIFLAPPPSSLLKPHCLLISHFSLLFIWFSIPFLLRTPRLLHTEKKTKTEPSIIKTPSSFVIGTQSAKLPKTASLRLFVTLGSEYKWRGGVLIIEASNFSQYSIKFENICGFWNEFVSHGHLHRLLARNSDFRLKTGHPI